MATIEPRKNGSYRIVVSAGYDLQGKKLRHYETVPAADLAGLTLRQKEKELERRKVLFEQKVKSGQYMDGERITFAAFAQKWLEDYASKNLAPKTVYEYSRLLENRIIPALGHIKLAKLQPNHIMKFYNNLAENGMRLDSKYRLKKDCIHLLEGIKNTDIGINTDTLSKIKKGNLTSKEVAEKGACILIALLKKCSVRKIKKRHYQKIL